ncbi:hypothetical protein QM012_009021 [Aureobasidium pullulans]|uniref:Uncharacterized protein n=1 Tax=Aureobasidium pullulans TaxID=5580 RepID=A0ABR0TI86_AURPU
MKIASITAAAAAMFIAMAEAQAFTLKIRSSDDSMNNLPLVAWNGMLIAERPGNSTTATCPPWDSDCPGKSTTIFSGPTLVGNATQMWMGILQEHGQRVYTHKPPKGLFESQGYGDLISYTAAGKDESANIPKVDVYGDLWTIWTIDNDNGLLGSKRGDNVLTNGLSGTAPFNICRSSRNPSGGETWILSTVAKYCTPVLVLVEETNVAAPQFYNCDGCEMRGNAAKDGPACLPPFCGSYKYWWI